MSGLSGFHVGDADEFRPTPRRALALLTPAVVEIPIDDRETRPLVQPMRLRSIDWSASGPPGILPQRVSSPNTYGCLSWRLQATRP
jgi:hypothetical protein